MKEVFRYSTFIVITFIGLALLHPPPAAAQNPPNFVFFLVDDLRQDGTSFTGHPFGQTPNIDRLANEGISFNNAFVTTSLCSPSRASFLTGKYIWSHGVLDNYTRLSPSQVTFPQLLQVAGYTTAFVGKWHMGEYDYPRFGFDLWVSFAGQGVYFDPTFNVNGQTVHLTGYNTDLLTDYAEDFLQSVGDEPFMLYLSYKAVHGPTTPATRHENLYPEGVYPVPPSGNATTAGKPADVQQAMLEWQAFTPQQQEDIINNTALKYSRTLAAVDESVQRIYSALQNMGELDNTVMVFTSDNGEVWREHGLTQKRWNYEPCTRIPWFVRYPPMITAGRTSDLAVMNVDLAPTFLDLAGVAIPDDVQGASLRPIFEDNVSSWRNTWLTEYVRERPDSVVPDTHDATFMNNLKYMYWLLTPYENELYDHTVDPLEITNVIDEPAYSAQLTAIIQEREQLAAMARPVPDWPYIDMGNTNITSGLQLIEPGDGETEAIIEESRGRECRRNLTPGQDIYMYFDIDDSFTFEGSKSDLYISIDYRGLGGGTLTLQYDSPGNIYQDGGSVSLASGGKWFRHTYHVTDAYFGNRQNGGADFRIERDKSDSFYLDIVQVRTFDPDVPAFAHNHSPAHRTENVDTDADLSWDAAGGALSHDVYFGTTNPPPFQQNQTATTFDPGTLQVYTTYYWRIDEVKPEGVTQGRVCKFTTRTYPGDLDKDLDVDQEDFGKFQACMSGNGLQFETGCQDANLDGDIDVDIDDFVIFQSCMAGANQTPPCQ